MKQKIICMCENSFEADIPEEIDLDSGDYIEKILNGSFLNFDCPSCGKKHKPEFPMMMLWPSRNLRFEVLRELDRGEFYRRKKPLPDNGKQILETLIGYPEMTDRIAVIRDGFEPVIIETLKYYLYLKTEEQYPDAEPEIWYIKASADSIEFHIHGLKDDEVAMMKLPIPLYQKTLDDYSKNPKSDLFKALRIHSYLSVKNTMQPEGFR